MESVNEIKEALSLRSRTATLDESRSEGRKRVRLIRAEHVAQMISEAVHAAIEPLAVVGAGDTGVVGDVQLVVELVGEERQVGIRIQRVDDAVVVEVGGWVGKRDVYVGLQRDGGDVVHAE